MRKNARLFLKENLFVFLTAIFVGVLSGYMSILLRELIAFIRWICLGSSSEMVSEVLCSPDFNRMRVVFFITLFSLGVGFITTRWAKEAKGHGVPEVMFAVAKNNARIKPRVVVIKTLASAMTIASGGSAGREGPIIQIGAALGSAVGQWFNLSVKKIRTLVACGAAAGIAATFNAPVAGVVFALDVILGEFNITSFSPVVVASVSGTVVSRHYLGNSPVFRIPFFEISYYWDYLFVSFLGLLCAAGALLFVKILYLSEDYFDTLRFSPYLKPAIGAFTTGLIILVFPLVYGGGYEAMEKMIFGKMALISVFSLIFVKILATAFTLGSGNSGGIFAPSLFIGGAVGCSFGMVLHRLVPGMSSDAGLYALLGMGGVVAAATHSPISAFLIIFEMTSNQNIILPLMITVVVSSIVAMAFSPFSIYTLKLFRRGIKLYSSKDELLMEKLKVKDFMQKQFVTLSDDFTCHEALEMTKKAFQIYFPVISSDKICGSVSLQFLHEKISQQMGEATLRSLISENEWKTPVPEPEDSLLKVIWILDEYSEDTLAVSENGKIVGIIRREDILSAYRKAIYDSIMERK